MCFRFIFELSRFLHKAILRETGKTVLSTQIKRKTPRHLNQQIRWENEWTWSMTNWKKKRHRINSIWLRAKKSKTKSFCHSFPMATRTKSKRFFFHFVNWKRWDRKILISMSTVFPILVDIRLMNDAIRNHYEANTGQSSHRIDSVPFEMNSMSDWIVFICLINDFCLSFSSRSIFLHFVLLSSSHSFCSVYWFSCVVNVQFAHSHTLTWTHSRQ